MAQSLVLANTAAVKLHFSGRKGKNLRNDVVIGSIYTVSTQSIQSETIQNESVQLIDRLLFLNSLNSTVNINVINLKCQTILKGLFDKTAVMDLSNLDLGVYIIRVTGKKLNIEKKILLK